MELIEQAKEILEMVMEAEEEARDNIPESLQGSERYEKAEEACDNLFEAIGYIEEAADSIEAAVA